jgi:hypothetical protein
MAYGIIRDEAFANTTAIAFRVIADRIEEKLAESLRSS